MKVGLVVSGGAGPFDRVRGNTMPPIEIYPKKHNREQHRAAIERSTRFDHIPHELPQVLSDDLLDQIERLREARHELETLLP